MWKKLDKLEKKFIKEVSILDLNEEIHQVYDSYYIGNEIATKSNIERFKRYVEINYKYLSNYGKYTAKKLVNKSKLSNKEIVNFILFILYSKKQNEIDEKINIIASELIRNAYGEETKKISKETGVKIPVFDIAIVSLIMAMSNSKGYMWQEYIEATTLYNSNEMYRSLLLNGDKEIKELLQKQKNRLLKNKKNQTKEDKYTGALEEQLVFAVNQAKLMAYKDMKIKKVKFIGVHDMSQTKMCESLEGKIFYIDKLNIYSRYSELDKNIITYKTFGLKTGENLPPINNNFHWCRSSITYLIDN